jgi:hypothetical protein
MSYLEGYLSAIDMLRKDKQDKLNNDMTLAKLRDWNQNQDLRDQQRIFGLQDLQSKMQLLPVQTQAELMKGQSAIQNQPQEDALSALTSRAKGMQAQDIINNFPQDSALKRLLSQSEIAKNLGAGKTNAQNVRLGVDEQMNPDGSVTIVPGSKTFRQQSSAHGKDYASLLESQNNSDMASGKIDYILDPKNKDSFNSMFGGYNAKFLTQYFPGQTQDMKAKLESLKSDLKVAGLNRIRAGGSVGAMTEREWPIVQDLIDRLDPTMSEDQARGVLADIKSRMEGGYSRAKEAYGAEWGGSQFGKDTPAKGDAKFLGFE